MSDSFYWLFDLVRDAVIICEQGEIVYFNPPAESLLGAELLRAGEAALFGELSTLPAPTAAFIDIGGKRLEAVLAAHGEGRIYRLSDTDPDSELSNLADSLSAGIGEVVQNHRLAADVVRPYLDGIDEEQFLRSFSILEHNDFRLVRDFGNITALGSSALLHIPGSEDCFDLSVFVNRLADSVRFFLNGRRIDTAGCKAGHAFICAAQADIERIVLNLLSNSVKYSDDSSVITISVRTAGSRCLLTVSDEGCGIPESRLADVFSAYRLSRPLDDTKAGTGLGLAVVRRLAEKYGGTVLMESHVGVGTSVTVCLPLSDSAPALLDDTSFYPSGAADLLTALADVLPAEYYSSLYLD